MIDPVEELLQVGVHHDPPARLHVRLRGQDRIVRTSPRLETVAVLAESRVQNRLQHLQQRLLDQPIRHRRDAQLALAAVQSRDRYPPYRTGPVCSPQQLFSYRRPRRHQLAGGLVYIQPVHPRSSFVGPHPLNARCKFSLVSAAISSADPMLSVSCRGLLASSLTGSRPASPCATPARSAGAHF